MPRLIQPRADLFLAWSEAHQEWGPGVHEDGFGLTADDDVTPHAFKRWVAELRDQPGQSWWVLDGNAIAGAIALRTDQDPAATRHGHIGYGIRPSFRGRGLATWALSRVLEAAAAQGRQRVHLVCRRDNVASARTIIRVGGEQEDRRAHLTVDRYVVNLATPGDDR